MENTEPKTAVRRMRNAFRDPVLAAVRAEMLAAGIDHIALAERLNYTPGTMRNVLADSGRPNWTARRKIEEFFGRSFWGEQK